MKLHKIRHEFVEFVPSELEEAVVYVSVHYATAVHLCCCGCGSKVVTPFSPVDWKLYFDGETVSLTPSIGNWNFPCKSHYWIKANRVQWDLVWSDDEIREIQVQQALEKESYMMGKIEKQNSTISPPESTPIWKRWLDRANPFKRKK